MSEGDGLVTHVPYLRRFARALTGSQVTGDACVVAALESLLAGKSADIAARIALYRAVLAEVNARDARPVIDARSRRAGQGCRPKSRSIDPYGSASVPARGDGGVHA